MVDTATVIPACGVYNSFFALLTEQEVGCILQQIRVCTKVTKQTAEDPNAHKLAVVYDMTPFDFRDENRRIANVDPMRQLQMLCTMRSNSIQTTMCLSWKVDITATCMSLY